jgi:hypothetical protein
MVKLDFITAKAFMSKGVLVFLGLVTIFLGFILKNYTSGFMVGMLVSLMYGLGPFAASLDLWYITFNLKRKEVVLGRIIFSTIILLGAACSCFLLMLLGTGISELTNINTKTPQSFHSFLKILPLCSLVILLLLWEISFNFKAKKSNVVHGILMLVFMTALMIFSFTNAIFDMDSFKVLLGDTLIFILDNLWLQYIVAGVAIIIGYFICYKVSVRAYSKRNF